MDMVSYRVGGLGAIMDEYQKAVNEYTGVLMKVTADQFTRIVDQHTADEHCRSIQTVSKHVVRSGYGYAGYVLSAVQCTAELPDTDKILIETPEQAVRETDIMLRFNFTNLYDLNRETIESHMYTVRFMTRWDEEYDIEQILEHGIVHVLRHRRQVEKFIKMQEKTGKSHDG